ncbi:MAG TPA: GNAT family N-acetyltransferase [Intrasporangium sp.]|uniref:GNAT family N-acetyltransferase n=1 Tax=Intrasporangium sp. TaxID=1925024 RepID=UPI002D765038|nr:GNAT family N-acetyltransferase [Intrasporangium sp.]HET7399268.1 GNAT family N-acetyltransferase [Intrasporangium sp.]
MSVEVPLPWADRFTATGQRVRVRPPTSADAAAYVEAVTRSAGRLSDFALPDPHNLPAVVAAQSATYRSFLILARDAAGDHGLVGRVNVANIVGGAFRSATLGYDAYDPYAGKGLFAEGLGLVLDIAFTDEPRGLGLHRVEANIQPANTRSAGVVRSLGFTHEGFSRGFLHMAGPDGRRDWRDHDRYAILSSDWPAAPYHRHSRTRLAAVVNLRPGWDAGRLAPQLAAELGLPLYGEHVVPDHDALWELLRISPVGGVVECRLSPPELRIGLARARFDPAVVPVVSSASEADKREVAALALRVRAAYA